jgi:hypothetical protein
MALAEKIQTFNKEAVQVSRQSPWEPRVWARWVSFDLRR